jgi:hypothetical protein
MATRKARTNRKPRPFVDRGPAYNPDIPTAGCYRHKLRRGGPPVALRFWLGPPIDPDTGEEMDRSPRWQCRLNGTELVPVDRFWPDCARFPISLAEHDRLCRLSATLDPASPYYDPRRAIDPLKTPLPF